MPTRNKFLRLKSWLFSARQVSLPCETSQVIQASRTNSTPILSPDPENHLDNWPCLRLLQTELVDKNGWVQSSTRPIWKIVRKFGKCIPIFKAHSETDQDYDVLWGELEESFKELRWHFTNNDDGLPSMTPALKRFCLLIELELSDLKEKCKFSGSAIISEVTNEIQVNEDTVLASYRRILSHFRCIVLNVSVWQNDRSIGYMGSAPEYLYYEPYARYFSKNTSKVKRGPCDKGTRVAPLNRIRDWVDNPCASSVYWINGMAGTGKTTIAYSLCEGLDNQHRLAASFFCSRWLQECGDSKSIIPTIAHQMAEFSGPFRCALLVILRDLDSDINLNEESPELQFKHLISGPLLEARNALPNPLVVVIDALDECEDKGGASQLLDVLLTSSSDLPVKFVVSSRPEPEIRNSIQKQCRATPRVILHQLHPQGVKGDIQAYFLRTLGIESDLRWLMEEERAALVERAGTFFLYAETIVQYIMNGEPTREACEKRLADILDPNTLEDLKFGGIDETYARILHSALEDPGLNEGDKNDIRQMLYLVACAEEPLTVEAISHQLKMNDVNRVWSALQRLWSVLHVSEDSGVVIMLHPSFPHYILNPLWEGKFFGDPTVYRQTMAYRCFRMFREMQPQFNICGLESSYVPDSAVNGLKERVRSVISADVLYTAQHWVEHVQSAHESVWSELLVDLKEFLSAQLLLWMEIMNLKECTHEIPEGLWKIGKWSSLIPNCPDDLKELIYDAWRFATTFTLGGVSNSTPHIYTSMLAFWPQSSPIGKCYAKRVQGLVELQGTAVARTRISLWATWGFECCTTSPVYSPDGSQVALGMGANILLLGALSGRILLPPFQGHSKKVLSIHFSPDGMRVVSSSVDKTIFVWSTESGEAVHGPLKGHNALVHSVTFSSDGASIASGSIDGTFCIWNSDTGARVLKCARHRGSVMGIKYTPNGYFIVSCGWPHVVVRNAANGRVLRTLEAKNPDEIFKSVDISRGGTIVASCTNLGSIYMWDIDTGTMILGPPETPTAGHPGLTSISFSPNGSWLVSGSADGTLYIWDARSGNMAIGPLEGHVSSITSAVFSPDGAYIISGSNDKTLRLWDATSIWAKPSQHDGILAFGMGSGSASRAAREWDDGMLRLLNASENRAKSNPGHAGSVTSVGLSPDGTQVVSGSYDQTICTWNAKSGKRTFITHAKSQSDRVLVAYSPDGTRILYNCPAGLAQLNTQTGQAALDPIQICQPIQSAGFTSDGAQIVLGSTRNIIRVLASDSGHTIVDIEPPATNRSDWLTSVVSSPDGARIAIGSIHSSLSMYDTRSGRWLYGPLEGRNNESRSLAFSPDSARIASGSVSAVIVRDVQNGDIILGPLNGHKDWVHSVEYSPDGKHIVSGANDNTICVWDAENGRLVLGPIKYHTAPVRSVRYSPDGTRVVSGSDDKTIRITNVEKEFEYPHGSLLPNGIEWELKNDGWIVDKQGRLLVWIPPELHISLMWPRTELLISRKGWLRLNFSEAHLGEMWMECCNA